jgi:putative phage-type endonuclease
VNYWEASPNQQPQAATAAWHANRRRGLGGSEIAIIQGLSPYRTAYSLWLEKTGRKEPDNISALPHVQRGIIGEKSCRLLLERKYLHSFTPKSWELGDVCRCNDDGFSLDLNWILEIKCMGKKAHEEARTGKVPEHYRLQCQWNLMVSGADKCLFVSFRPEDEDMVEIEIFPNQEEHKILKASAERWWEVHVVRDMAPKLTSKDYVPCDLEDYVTAARRYRLLKNEIDHMEEEVEQLREKLTSFVTADIPAIKGSGIKVSRSTRQGAIDYKGIEVLSHVDLERYRKPSTIVTTITLEGDSSETT